MTAHRAPSSAPLPPGAAAPAAVPRVAVCVATCRRPQGVARLLESLAALELAPGEADLVVVVVDNDGEGSARAPVREARLPFPLLYAVEPERNIALARNRGVALALERGADWIAFVDDDEVVPPRWIGEMLLARTEYRADVVMGRVVHDFPPGTPRWLAHPRFFGGDTRRSGARLPVANTNNVLVAAHLLQVPGGPFDPRFGITGGSDSHLFMRLNHEGARIVYAGEAVAQETIPESRAHTGWVLRRAFRVGNTAMLCERALPAGRPGLRLLKASMRLGYGAATLPLAVLGRARLMHSLWNVAYGFGAAAGLLGIRYQEYKRLHGD